MRQGIIAAGNFIVDRVKIIDQFPAQDTLASILSQADSNGGGPYNLLKDLALMQVSYPLHAAGLIGSDSAGKWILHDCEAHHISTTLLEVSPDYSTSYTDVMTVESNGRRTFFHQRGANAHFSGSNIPFADSTSKIFHLGYLLLLDHLDSFAPDGRTHAAHLLARASAAGLTTSVDLVSAAHPHFREIVLSALPHADFLFLNEIEAEHLLGHPIAVGAPAEIAAAASALLTHGTRHTVTLHTAAHAVSVCRSGEIHHQAALQIPPETLRGTNGAGDAFAAGFLHAIHEELSIPAALALAVRVAAASLTHPTPSGGIDPHCLNL